jgi:AcrR family transcriptional regulator
MGRPAKNILNRLLIAQTALQLIDEAGAQGMTMRAIAEQLGVSAPSLYHHIATKDDLIGAIAELLNAQIDPAPLQQVDWRLGLSQYAFAYRAVYLQHPNFIPLVARAVVSSSDALASYDAMLAALRRAGCSVKLAAATVAALDYLVLGSALETFTCGFSQVAADYRGHYPHLADAIEMASADPRSLDDSGFELGLTMLLDGVQRRLAEGMAS